MFKLEAKTGLISCTDGPFKKGRAVFNIDGAFIDSGSLKWKGTAQKLTSLYNGAELIIAVVKGELSFKVTNKATTPIILENVFLRFDACNTDEPLEASEHLEYIHSFNFEKMCSVKKVGQKNRWLEHNPYSSLLYIAYNRENSRSTLFSTLPPHRGDFVSFRALHDSPHLEGLFGLETKFEISCELAKGASFTTSSIQCREGANPLLMLKEVGVQWGKSVSGKLKKKITGWNSWDFYASAISSKEIFANQKAAKKLFGKKLTHFGIDDGYQANWGDWETNYHFPEGHPGFCKKIRGAGGVPGIWCAPLLVYEFSEFFRENPDMFARDKSGQIVFDDYSSGSCAHLDPTNPKTQKWLTALYKNLKKAGYRYFKVDFTQMVVSKCESFYNKSVPRGAIVRKAFETIRKAVGADSYILACGAPYESVTGIVDAARSTGDIHNRWGHVLANANSIASRWWMNGQIWNNDPDFLIVRGPETSKDKHLNREIRVEPLNADKDNYWRSGRDLNTEELKSLAMLVYVSAGDVFLSDNLATLTAKGTSIIKKVMEKPLTQSAVPIDLFDSHDGTPSLWLSKEKDFWFVAMFNWDEDAVEATVDLHALGIDDVKSVKTFWENKPLKPADGFISLPLKSRCCEGLVIARKK